jgi:hypothetical protein
MYEYEDKILKIIWSIKLILRLTKLNNNWDEKLLTNSLIFSEFLK